MAEQPSKEFGKRRPQTSAPHEPPSKRSPHVALLLMGTFAVGGAAYSVMAHRNCPPAPSPGMAAPAVPQPNGDTGCTSRGSSSSSTGHGGSRYSFFSDDSSIHSSSSGSSEASSSSVSRGGFGSFAHAFGFSGG
jgi:hypothetical protein